MDQAALDALTIQNAGSMKRQADAAEASVTLFRGQLDAVEADEDKKRYLDIFSACLRERRSGAVITTGTADTVIDDIVTDAARMTNKAWALLKPELDKI